MKIVISSLGESRAVRSVGDYHHLNQELLASLAHLPVVINFIGSPGEALMAIYCHFDSHEAFIAFYPELIKLIAAAGYDTQNCQIDRS